jgi:Rieske Fe-S protein
LNRRQFCSKTCGALSIAAAGAFAAACSNNPTAPGLTFSSLPVVNGTVSGNAITVTVDATSPLASVGGAAVVQTSAGTLLAARTDQNTVTAVSAACTHASCLVSGISGSNYVCPCHGSMFTFAGSVVQGPAASPLSTFATQLSGTTLTVTF